MANITICLDSSTSLTRKNSILQISIKKVNTQKVAALASNLTVQKKLFMILNQILKKLLCNNVKIENILKK